MGRKKSSSQEFVLRVIQKWILDHGAAPTIEELRRELSVGSTRTVLRYLLDLEESGAIERWPGARGLRPLRSSGKSSETVAVPLVGQAPAGPFMTAEQNVEGWVQLPREFVRRDAKHFLLRVRGNSMNRALVEGKRIQDGDLVLVQKQETAREGNIVIALVDGEATIKRFARGPDYIVLKPESSENTFRSMLLTNDFRVQGIVKRVLKKGAALLTTDTQ